MSGKLSNLFAFYQCGIDFVLVCCLHLTEAASLGASFGPLKGYRGWDRNVDVPLGNARKWTPFGDLLAITLETTMLLGMARGCFELMLLAV